MALNIQLKNKVFSITGCTFEGEITEKANVKGTYVKYDGESAVIGFSTIPEQARCYFLLSMHISNGETSFEISETPVFDSIGPMLDVSRGKAMRVDAIKRYIDIIAALGMNMFMLYTEDMFEVEGYPMFGYLRGRYSVAELKEVDDYAYSLGIEVIPCIQTLAHLGNYLRWNEARSFAENKTTLLPGDEKTYNFIEAEIKTIRKAFRSDKIHLGMDEAYGLGLGKYFKLHGLEDESDIFYAHLNKVLDISKKYFSSPMIWSDMLFNNPEGIAYWDKFIVPQQRVDNMPKGVDLVFWDYYHQTYEYYDTLLTQHDRFDNTTVFGGGLWTWDGIAPNFTYTLNTSKPAMQACIEHNVKTVIITVWASGGCAADFMQAVPGLTVFSEYCYKGNNCTDDDIYAASEHISGVDRELYHAISDQYIGLKGASSFGKAVLFGDPLVDLVKFDVDYTAALGIYSNALNVIKAHADYKYRDFYICLFEIGVRKIELYANLKKAYKAGDREYLERAAHRILPEIIEFFDEFYALFKTYWHKDYKVLDIMMYTHDMGGARLRLSDSIETLRNYLDGKDSKIEELEEEILNGINKTWRRPHDYITNFN